MKYLAAVLMLALAVATSILPATDDPVYGDDAAISTPPLSICPVVEAGGRTTDIAVLSSVNGAGRLSAFAAGSELGAVDFRTGGSGSVVIPAADAGSIGFAGALVEMPSESTVSGVTVSGETTLSSESCADLPSGVASISGGSTAGEASFDLLLLNPYSAEAIVDLRVSSESGVETDSAFDSVIVPALSTRVVDMGSILPERERITVSMEAASGAVLGVGRQTIEGETAIWRAVEPGQDWWIPVPAGSQPREILISSASASAAEYQVDVYTTDGFMEGFEGGTVDARGEAVIPLGEISEDAMGVRVITAGPTVATLRMTTARGVAATTGTPVDSTVWLLPGASLPAGGSASLVVVNTGIDAIDVAVRSLKDDSLVRNFTVEAEGVLAVDLVVAEGYRIEASGPVAALWTARINGAISLSIGTPIQDG